MYIYEYIYELQRIKFYRIPVTRLPVRTRLLGPHENWSFLLNPGAPQVTFGLILSIKSLRNCLKVSVKRCDPPQ